MGLFDRKNQHKQTDNTASVDHKNLYRQPQLSPLASYTPAVSGFIGGLVLGSPFGPVGIAIGGAVGVFCGYKVGSRG